MTVLDGMLVVELSGGVAVPAAGMFLADYGARVVKVETADGDPYRSRAGFQSLNRGKASLRVDSSGPVERQRILNLLRVADVCLSRGAASWRRLGLDEQQVRRDNPRLVVASMPPYDGVSDSLEPDGEPVESHELLSAPLGVAMNQCSFEGGPIEMVEPHLLYVHGALGALAVTAALLDREQTGTARAVTVTGAHAVIAFAPQLLVFDPKNPQKTRDLGPGGAHPLYSSYETSDGRWVFVGALSDKFIRRALEVFGLKELLDDPRIAQHSDRLYGPDNRRWVRARLAERLVTRSQSEWMLDLEAADIPYAPVQTPQEWLEHPQFEAACGQVRLDHPRLGAVSMPGSPFRLTGSPARIGRAAPELGADVDPAGPEDRHEDAGLARGRRHDTPRREDGGPLAGIRVLSVGSYVAGPYAARLMYLLGADVVKVEPPGGDPWRRYGFQFSEGMQSVSLDLRTVDGQEAFHRLVVGADAVIDNFRPGFLESVRGDHDSLTTANPAIVTTSLTGFGERGPLTRRPGFDPVLGAFSGMQTVQGGAAEPVVFSLAVNDTSGAVLAALATTLALFHRVRTGRGQHVECSLAGAACYLQTDTLVRYADRPQPRVGGRDFRGCRAGARYYRTSDGWVRVEDPSGGRDVAARLQVSPPVLAADAVSAIAGAIVTRTTAEVIDLLTGGVVRAAPARTARDAVTAADRPAVPLAHWVEPAGASPYYTAADVAQFEGAAPRSPAVVPGVGEQSDVLLARAGLDAARIEAMRAAGTVEQGGPYLPVVLEPYR